VVPKHFHGVDKKWLVLLISLKVQKPKINSQVYKPPSHINHAKELKISMRHQIFQRQINGK
jgi:hypothetical protein